ncbi:hypothetical protein CEV34_2027 [Brucella pseudogrignonensis]|uniref:Uncharacterized protein n=1 Tax=Brucella pseudogrignonensis TaxID=419475 RepID=A0A256GM44_9HYPH|nr:hypothetical protein CEV34_2027 [Brucella pseudogrignonensis]
MNCLVGSRSVSLGGRNLAPDFLLQREENASLLRDRKQTIW